MRITVRQYYGGFVSLWGLAAGAPFVPPLLHVFIPDSSKLADYLYPPLGDVEFVAVAATVGCLLVSTFVVFTCCESARKIHRRAPLILGCGVAFCACALIVLYVLYVRRVPVQSVDLEVPVSIGYHKTDLAHQEAFSKLTGVEILQRTGPTEDQIQKLWTPHSICVARVLLWLFYTLTVTCFVCVISLIVYQHAAEESQIQSARGAPEQATP
jgi:MFS family permease